jgi:hypothetical protein
MTGQHSLNKIYFNQVGAGGGSNAMDASNPGHAKEDSIRECG